MGTTRIGFALLAAGFVSYGMDALLAMDLPLARLGAILLFLGLLSAWRSTPKEEKPPRRLLLAGMALIWIAHSMSRVGAKLLASDSATLDMLVKGLTLVVLAGTFVHIAGALGVFLLLAMRERALALVAVLLWTMGAAFDLVPIHFPSAPLPPAETTVLRGLELAGSLVAALAALLALLRARGEGLTPRTGEAHGGLPEK